MVALLPPCHQQRREKSANLTHLSCWSLTSDVVDPATLSIRSSSTLIFVSFSDASRLVRAFQPTCSSGFGTYIVGDGIILGLHVCFVACFCGVEPISMDHNYHVKHNSLID